MKKICDVFGPRIEESKLCPIVLTSKADLAFDCRGYETGNVPNYHNGFCSCFTLPRVFFCSSE